MTQPIDRSRNTARRYAGLAIAVAAGAAGAAILHDPAAAILLLALALAILATGLRHYLRKDPRR